MTRNSRRHGLISTTSNTQRAMSTAYSRQASSYCSPRSTASIFLSQSQTKILPYHQAPPRLSSQTCSPPQAPPPAPTSTHSYSPSHAPRNSASHSSQKPSAAPTTSSTPYATRPPATPSS